MEKDEDMVDDGEDDWEYYDDTTTLSDLWQTLTDKKTNDPVEEWLKEAAKSDQDLELAVHDFWRIMVPLHLAPSYGYTSVDQRFDEKNIQDHLIGPLESFICGENVEETYEVRIKTCVLVSLGYFQAFFESPRTF